MSVGLYVVKRVLGKYVELINLQIIESEIRT